MDKLTKYRQIVTDLILKYARFRPSHGDIRLDPLFDEKRDGYALMQVGWDRGKRIKGNLIYLTLKDGKVYVEYDGMEKGIADELVSMGVAPEDIILACQAPDLASSNQLNSGIY